jgi:hypothetical protein
MNASNARRDRCARSIGFMLAGALMLMFPMGADAQVDPPSCEYCVDEYFDHIPEFEGWYHKFESTGSGDPLNCAVSTFGGHPTGCGESYWHPTNADELADYCWEFHPDCDGVGLALQDFLDGVRREERGLQASDLEAIRGLGARVQFVHAGLVQVTDCSGAVRSLVSVGQLDAAD